MALFIALQIFILEIFFAVVPRFQRFTNQDQGTSSETPIVIVPQDVEANQQVAHDQLDVEGSVSATFGSPSPLTSISLSLKYKSERKAYPDLQKLNLASFQSTSPPCQL